MYFGISVEKWEKCPVIKSPFLLWSVFNLISIGTTLSFIDDLRRVKRDYFPNIEFLLDFYLIVIPKFYLFNFISTLLIYLDVAIVWLLAKILLLFQLSFFAIFYLAFDD